VAAKRNTNYELRTTINEPETRDQKLIVAKGQRHKGTKGKEIRL
jgi:hypothetical protein